MKYQLWTRRWLRVGAASEDREALEREATRLAEYEGFDACVYEAGEDPNEDEEDLSEVEIPADEDA